MHCMHAKAHGIHKPKHVYRALGAYAQVHRHAHTRIPHTKPIVCLNGATLMLACLSVSACNV